MKVLHVIPSISAVHGGPSAAIRSIVAATSALGAEVEVATTDDDGPGRRLDSTADGSAHDIDGMRVRLFPRQTGFYKVSLPMSRWLRAHVADYDVVHIHALFSFSSVAAARAARRAGVPYVVSPIGALNAYGMSKRRPWLKRASFRLLERPILERAAAVHFTTEQELSEARGRAALRRADVIPLGVEMPDAAAVSRRAPPSPESATLHRIVFVGRMDPVKNVEALIGAVPGVLAVHPDAQFLIAGDGDAGYTARLRRLATDLGVEKSIRWLGHVADDAKRRLLAEASVFVLPSHSENFGVAAAEALAAGVPCVLSRGVAIAGAVATAGAGVAVEPTPEGVAGGLGTFLADGPRRASASLAARRLAEAQYSTRRMGAALMALYARVVLERRAGRA